MKAEGTGPLFDIEYNPNLWQTTIEKDLPNLRDFIKDAWENRDPSRTYADIRTAAVRAQIAPKSSAWEATGKM